MLQKLEEEDHDWVKTDKTRSVVEKLQADILSLQESISLTCSTISKLIDEELYPQLIALISGYELKFFSLFRMFQCLNTLSLSLSQFNVYVAKNV